MESKGKEVIQNLEKKTKKIKADIENNEKAEFIMRTLKRKAKNDYEIEDLTEEKISKSIKTNNGKEVLIQREKKNKN